MPPSLMLLCLWCDRAKTMDCVCAFDQKGVQEARCLTSVAGFSTLIPI